MRLGWIAPALVMALALIVQPAVIAQVAPAQIAPAQGALEDGAPPPGSAEKARIDWIAASIYDYGPGRIKAEPNLCLRVKFAAKVEFVAATPEDVAELRVTLGADSYFSLPIAYNAAKMTYDSSSYFSDTRFSANRSVLQLNGLALELIFKDKSVVRKRFSISAPGKKENEGERYLAGVNYEGPWTSGMSRGLAVGDIVESLVESGELVLHFRFEDSRVGNGFLTFSSAGNKKSYSTSLFVESVSRKPDKRLNNGLGFYTDGRLNEYRIPLSEVAQGKTFAGDPAVAVCVFLMDRAPQGAASATIRDSHISVSDRFPLPSLDPSIAAAR